MRYIFPILLIWVGGFLIGIYVTTNFIVKPVVINDVDNNKTLREFMYDNFQEDYKQRYTDWKQYEKEK